MKELVRYDAANDFYDFDVGNGFAHESLYHYSDARYFDKAYEASIRDLWEKPWFTVEHLGQLLLLIRQRGVVNGTI